VDLNVGVKSRFSNNFERRREVDGEGEKEGGRRARRGRGVIRILLLSLLVKGFCKIKSSIQEQGLCFL
jgi:hypothetical protein